MTSTPTPPTFDYCEVVGELSSIRGLRCAAYEITSIDWVTGKPIALTPDKPTTGAKPGMAMPLGASLNKDDQTLDEINKATTEKMTKWALDRELDRDEKNRQLARLGAAMPKVIGR